MATASGSSPALSKSITLSPVAPPPKKAAYRFISGLRSPSRSRRGKPTALVPTASVSNAQARGALSVDLRLEEHARVAPMRVTHLRVFKRSELFLSQAPALGDR
jgi:hypothetical protein